MEKGKSNYVFLCLSLNVCVQCHLWLSQQFLFVMLYLNLVLLHSGDDTFHIQLCLPHLLSPTDRALYFEMILFGKS